MAHHHDEGLGQETEGHILNQEAERDECLCLVLFVVSLGAQHTDWYCLTPRVRQVNFSGYIITDMLGSVFPW